MRLDRSKAVVRLQSMLDDHVKLFGAVGVMVGVDLPGRPRFYLASGKRAPGAREALSHADLYRIASQTKTFVAVAVLALTRDGVVSLDDPVVKHLGAPIDPRITLKHLIMNSSGVVEILAIPEAVADMALHRTPDELLRYVLDKPVQFEPGERFDYSNTGWLIAAMVLDATAPGGYAGYLKTRVLAPLGLGDTSFDAEAPRQRVAKDSASDQSPLSMSWAYGAGDLVSSLDDMLNFYRALSRPENACGVTLKDLTAESLSAGQSPIHPLSLGADYAFGLERRSWGGVTTWGHPGRVPGCFSGTWIAPPTGAIVATAYMSGGDLGESQLLQAQRYNAPLIFTQAMMTALELQDTAIEATAPSDV